MITILTYMLYAAVAIMVAIALYFAASVHFMRRHHISMLKADKVVGELLRSGYSCAFVGFLPFPEWLKP